MNPRLLPFLATVLLSPAVNAKPPPPTRSSPSPVPAVADENPPSLLRWLLLQNGGPMAAAVPWPEIVRAAGGKPVKPLDPANAADITALAKLAAALDTILPRLNRPDGPTRNSLTTTEVSARVAEELRITLVAKNLPAAGAPCPTLRWNDAPGGRTFYLIVAAYPTGGKDAAFRALTVRPADLAGQITADGACLLIGVEHNGKTGRDLALLGWEIIDLAKVSLHSAVTFEADTNGLHVPGATLGDSRRGRD